jgi:hypothetical protein
MQSQLHNAAQLIDQKQKLLSSGKHASMPQASPQMAPSSPRINFLWMKLGFIFAEKFTGRFDTPAAVKIAQQTWEEALKDFSDEQLYKALEACTRWGKEFAPTLPEFIALIPPQKKQDFHAAGLPLPETEKERRTKVAEKHIAEMRQILRRNGAKFKPLPAHVRGTDR